MLFKIFYIKTEINNQLLFTFFPKLVFLNNSYDI